MKKNNPRYQTPGYFPQHINFVESEAQDFKPQVFSQIPKECENVQEGHLRAITLVEIMAKKSKYFQGAEKGICYLIVGHEEWVAFAGRIFDFMEAKFYPFPNLYIPKTFMTNLSDTHRGEIENYLQKESEKEKIYIGPCSMSAMAIKGP